MAKAYVFKVVKRFKGYPTEEDFEMVEEELPPLNDGEVLVKTLYLSVDPYMRNFFQTLPLGSPIIIGGAVGRIIESKNPAFQEGDIVYGFSGWRTAFVSDGKNILKATQLPPDVPESLAVGILGMPGHTAYFGLLEVCQAKAGETVLVNAAAGAVGSAVGQIAKIKGCTVIGFAGTDEKVDYLKSIGFDHAFNYKTVDLHETLTQTVPGGINVFYDNVGGEFSDTVILHHMKEFGRVAICGNISQHNLKPPSDVHDQASKVQTMGQRLQGSILAKQLKIEGFTFKQYVERMNEANKALVQWIQEGKLKWREHVTEGFENMPKAFIEMLKGANIGKAIVKNTDV
jgi:prostaglandin reductase 1